MILLSEIDLLFCRGLRDKSDRRVRQEEISLRRVRPGVLPRVRLQRLVSVYQFILDGIAGQFSIRFHSHLFQDPRTVRADSAVAQREQLGNLARRFS